MAGEVKPLPVQVDHRPVSRLRSLLVALLGLAACQVPAFDPDPPQLTVASTQTDLPVARAPYTSVSASWKQRLDQPYVYVEARGDYRNVGRSLERVLELADAANLEPQGPPFALFYDDPGRVPLDQLRLRACLPVAALVQVEVPLLYEVLDSTTVVYAYVGGPYPEVARAYPGLFAYLRELDWVEAGPIREIYLKDPAEVASWDELVTEIQIPAMRRP